MDSIKTQPASNLNVLHLSEESFNSLLVAFSGLSFQLQLCSKTDDEGQHEDEGKGSTCDDQFFLFTNHLFTVFGFVLFLSFIQVFLVFIFLVDLIIQNLVIALAVFHLPVQVGIGVNLCKPSSDSFVLAHGLELCGFMQTDLLKVRGGFFLEKFLVFFVQVNLNFWFRVCKVISGFSIRLTDLLASFSRFLLIFGLVLRFDSDGLIVFCPFGLVAECLVGFLYLLEAISICAFVNVGVIDLGQFEVIFLDGGGCGVLGNLEDLVECFLFLGLCCCEGVVDS